MSTLTTDLALRDHTDPGRGPHAIQLMIDEILAAVAARYSGDLRIERGDRIVQVADNYDRLGYGTDARARDARYTRYVDETRMLRSQTSALIPAVLRRLAADPRATAQAYEVTIACPGIVYRRDVIDRLHTGTPHQLDLWHLGPDSPGETDYGLAQPPEPSGRYGGIPARTDMTPGPRPTPAARSKGARAAVGGESSPGSPGRGDDLAGLIATVLGAALPGVPWRLHPAEHPYTEGGVEIEACVAGRWVEIGEGGRASRRVLRGAGLPPYVGGLALGLGLDRLVMVRKGVPDIRALRSADPRVAGQMLDLAPWRPVSAHPPARRDVSVAMRAGVTAEEVGDLVRVSLGDDARLIEEIAVLGMTGIAELPPAARERLGIADGEVNVLLRVILRDLDGSIPGELANELRDRISAALHHAGPTNLAS
jgi:phenylalanyl-tRNA synthetase alpha chain